MTAALQIDGLSAGYTDEPIVRDVTLAIAAASITTLVGSNGAGKSTLLKAIYGLNRRFGGAIRFDGKPIETLSPAQRLRRGLGFVPQGRCNFPLMTVQENLDLGGYILDAPARATEIERVMGLFPVLAQRRAVLAGNLSGGEQQIMEMAMVLMTRPRMLLLDEPSIGLSPINVAYVLDNVRQIRTSGVTVLMVEQNVKGALRISDRAIVMELGRIIADGPAHEIANDPSIAKAYLGRR